MDRAEATGFGIATTGHVALLVALSVGFAASQNVPAPPVQTIEVSFAEDVALVSSAPEPTIEPPAQSVAPELGPPEEPAPAPEPEPAPPQPQPEPAPAPPQPQPRPQPKQAAPAPAQEKARPQPAREQPAPKQKAAAPPATKATESGTAAAERPRGSRLGPDLLKGIGRDPSPSTDTRPTGAVMSAQAAADIGSAILRQVQPCADRQVSPGPGAERIVTPISLRLNRDGSLAARPTVGRQTGIDDENRRYAERVADLAIATFVGCSPLRGLPQELYEVPNGWRNFTLRYRLPG
ncbi:MAG: cell envelope biogenesis protein TolA [Allosphingosinicella sp.]|uniref:cell envelope biogenesis protein TolA n=1 Tax=Allosphingosinicella sp. TaxID=2823234 RepID=UPI003925043A